MAEELHQDLNQTKDDTVSDQHLFDFDEPLFGDDADNTQKEWENDFIEFGRELEKTPVGYIRHVLGLLDFNGDSKSLEEYKSNYLWNTGLYGYQFFAAPNSEIYFTKESLREAYLISHVSRSEENVTRLWDNFGYLAVEVISPYMSVGRKERTYVQGLIDTWTCITEKKHYEKKLKDIYEQITLLKPNCDELVDYVKPLMCESLNQQFTRTSDYSKSRDVQWIYTFWVRRYHEGNVEVTFKILESLIK